MLIDIFLDDSSLFTVKHKLITSMNFESEDRPKQGDLIIITLITYKVIGMVYNNNGTKPYLLVNKN